MIYEPSAVAVVVFVLFVGVTLALSFYLGNRAKSSQGYFAAHGQIPWVVNGLAFAGDYLSAASFLGICGMIAFYGYDGFLYSIGYLAGWIVALFVVAEPLKRLGKFTFADALDARFGSPGIKLAAGISTLAVSIFYLIPQMVGAGVLIQPLLGFPHWVGVMLVGATVIVVVVTAGMVSTTYVQFLKGSLLVVFSFVLTVIILGRGFEAASGGRDGHTFRQLGPFPADVDHGSWQLPPTLTGAAPLGDTAVPIIRCDDAVLGRPSYWSVRESGPGTVTLLEAQTVSRNAAGETLVNGQVKGSQKGEPELHPVGHVSKLPGGKTSTGPLGPLSFFRALQASEVVLWGVQQATDLDGQPLTVYYQKPTPGSQVLRPGEHPRFQGIRSGRAIDKLNFLSLMLALFCGTASLPHILIRYYTVKDEASARKSTIVGIASIGFFYVLTLYLGLGAMTSGSLDVTNTNMAAPLLAKSISQWLFAIISAIAFTTVLGTVSGLILASAGAVTHDLISSFMGIKLTDHEKVRVAKVASVVVGAVAIVLGILFKELNVSYLVGWAFSVAASANLPSLVMLLFWKGVTRQGVITAVVVGMTSSLAWILASGDTFSKVYGLSADQALVPFSQPGIVTIPLGFLTLIVVSLLTRNAGSWLNAAGGLTRSVPGPLPNRRYRSGSVQPLPLVVEASRRKPLHFPTRTEYDHGTGTPCTGRHRTGSVGEAAPRRTEKAKTVTSEEAGLPREEISPYLICRRCGDQIECAIWRLDDGQQALALFLSQESAEAYTKTAALDEQWRPYRPAREDLLEILRQSTAGGVQLAALEPDHAQARTLFDLQEIVKSNR